MTSPTGHQLRHCKLVPYCYDLYINVIIKSLLLIMSNKVEIFYRNINFIC